MEMMQKADAENKWCRLGQCRCSEKW